MSITVNTNDAPPASSAWAVWLLAILAVSAAAGVVLYQHFRSAPTQETRTAPAARPQAIVPPPMQLLPGPPATPPSRTPMPRVLPPATNQPPDDINEDLNRRLDRLLKHSSR